MLHCSIDANYATMSCTDRPNRPKQLLSADLSSTYQTHADLVQSYYENVQNHLIFMTIS